MTIDNIKSSGLYKASESSIKSKYKDSDKSRETEASSLSREDSLVLSSEAKKLSPIKAKIESGFYNQPDVLREVAQKLVKEFNLE